MRCAFPLFHTVLLFIPLFAPRRPRLALRWGPWWGGPDGVVCWSKQQTAARCSSHPGPCAHQTRKECYLVWTKHPVQLIFPQQTCRLTAPLARSGPRLQNTFTRQILITCFRAEIPHKAWHCFQIGPKFKKRINTGSGELQFFAMHRAISEVWLCLKVQCVRFSGI